MPIKLALTSLPVFQFIAPAHTQTLSEISRVLRKDAGEAVILRGEDVTGVFLVASGSVGVYATDTPRPLARLAVGESFGEMSFLQNIKASATVRAEEDGTQLVLLRKQDLAEAAQADADLGRALYRGVAVTLSMRLAYTNSRIAVELTAGHRLLRELAADDETASDLARLPAAIDTHHLAFLRDLERALALGDELARRPSDRTKVAPLLQQLGELKARCAAFFPRLSRQVGAIVGFVSSMEDLAALTDRE